MHDDTIYAVATGEVAAALSVIRVSGSKAPLIVETLAGDLPAPRFAALRSLVDPESGETIDEAIVLRFLGGASFTGEDVVEFHVHGGAAVRTMLYRALERLGARLAEPGEFARRRFEAGRLDVSQAEALAVLVAAETQAQRRHAQQLLDGALGRRTRAWREALVAVLALLEAGLDFSDEEIGADTERDGETRLKAVATVLSQELAQVAVDQRALSTPSVAIIGPPNAGKSTLLNRLTDEDLAIVTPIPGATRDPIRSRVIIGDASIELIDTAGLRPTSDEVETLGVSRAQELAERADLRLIVVSEDVVGDAGWSLSLRQPGDIVVWSKSDLASPSKAVHDLCDTVVSVSVEDSSSLSALRSTIADRMIPRAPALSPIAGSERRKRLCAAAHLEIERAVADVGNGRSEAAIERVRSALRSLEGLVGRVDQEEVYSEIFSRFCIGK